MCLLAADRARSSRACAAEGANLQAAGELQVEKILHRGWTTRSGADQRAGRDLLGSPASLPERFRRLRAHMRDRLLFAVLSSTTSDCVETGLPQRAWVIHLGNRIDFVGRKAEGEPRARVDGATCSRRRQRVLDRTGGAAGRAAGGGLSRPRDRPDADAARPLQRDPAAAAAA